MSSKEIVGTTTVLLNAGGQELAVVLSSTIYYLLNNPACVRTAQDEAVASESNTYMTAAISEALRLHPPAAGNFQRRTGKAGHMVDGYYIPPDVSRQITKFLNTTWGLNADRFRLLSE
jgi:cytochrome P450